MIANQQLHYQCRESILKGPPASLYLSLLREIELFFLTGCSLSQSGNILGCTLCGCLWRMINVGGRDCSLLDVGMEHLRLLRSVQNISKVPARNDAIGLEKLGEGAAAFWKGHQGVSGDSNVKLYRRGGCLSPHLTIH